MATVLSTKKQVLLAFLERGVAMVHLDARRPGVVVPSQHAEDAHLRLNLSYRYRIPDFTIDGEGVQATLSFGGRAFHCVLPWEAIFGITGAGSGDGQVWPEDLPVEVAAAVSEQEPEQEAPEGPRISLAPVSEPPAAPQEETARPREDAPRPKLRLVR